MVSIFLACQVTFYLLASLHTQKGVFWDTLLRSWGQSRNILHESHLESPMYFNQCWSRHASLDHASTTEPYKNYHNPNIGSRSRGHCSWEPFSSESELEPEPWGHKTRGRSRGPRTECCPGAAAGAVQDISGSESLLLTIQCRP